jgi:Na+/H+-dicarboxylate symporter
MKKLELHWQILIAIVLAGLVGWAVNSAIAGGNENPSFLGISFIAFFDYIGQLFLNALKMIIVPLIFSSILIGVAGIGSGGNIGALGGRTLLFYFVTTLAAICIGLLLINFVGPGYENGEPVREMLALDASADELVALAEGRGQGFSRHGAAKHRQGGRRRANAGNNLFRPAVRLFYDARHA